MNRQRIIDAIDLAHRIVRQHLSVQPGENVLIVADPETARWIRETFSADAVEMEGANPDPDPELLSSIGGGSTLPS